MLNRTESPEPLVEDWRSFETLELPPILAVARAAFQDRGYHATSVRDIARDVGVTVPTIYYHYESKQGLLVALLIRHIRELLHRCTSAVEEAGGRPRDRLLNFVEAVVLWTTNRREVAVLDQERRSLDSDNRIEYVSYRDKIERLLDDALEDGVLQGLFAIEDVRTVARAILSMIRGIPGWYHEDGALSPEEIVRIYQDLALRMVIASSRVG